MSNNTLNTPVSDTVSDENVNVTDALNKAQRYAEHTRATEATEAARMLTGDSAGAQALIEMMNGNPQAFAAIVSKMSEQHARTVAREDVEKHKWALNIAQQAVEQFMVGEVDTNGSLGIRAQVQGLIVEKDESGHDREENWTISMTFKRTSSIRRANKPVLRSDRAATTTTVSSSAGTASFADLFNKRR